MYFYSLYGYDELTILTHEEEFTKEQFKAMCKEAPLFIHYSCRAYDSSKIEKYLKDVYGFRNLVSTAGFFIDADVE